MTIVNIYRLSFIKKIKYLIENDIVLSLRLITD